jgi:hypothetical protein
MDRGEEMVRLTILSIMKPPFPHLQFSKEEQATILPHFYTELYHQMKWWRSFLMQHHEALMRVSATGSCF